MFSGYPRGSPPCPLHGSGNTEGARWYPILYRTPSPASSFVIGLKIKIRFKSALAGLRPCAQLPSLRALAELKDPPLGREWVQPFLDASS